MLALVPSAESVSGVYEDVKIKGVKLTGLVIGAS